MKFDPLFGTGHDEANRAALAATGTDDMSIAGFAVHGPKNDVDRALKGLKLHPRRDAPLPLAGRIAPGK